MATLSLRATGPAPVGTVWRRYTEFQQWPSWSPQIRAVHTDTACIAPGVRGSVESVLGISVAFVVEDVDHERCSWSWRVRLGPVRVRLRHDVYVRRTGTASGTGAETRLVLRGPLLALVAYAPLAYLALRRLVHEEALNVDRPPRPT
ncbi:SRPBCC family protein [Streptomyces sp. SD11]|uniref:SRPBCC family protein n=1 Tax=unclassified Streptomyces TaxID=2593676 RepID=UPI00200D7787|nr:SRPBCC family protein [Streptomyces sp. LRE541]UPZ26624.1 SRPBCC family protein [Streptomyces sp. LRE541]